MFDCDLLDPVESDNISIKSIIKNARGDMLARFLGFGSEVSRGDAPVWMASPVDGRARSTSSAPVKRPRRTPVLARDKTLPEFELDRRVAYWALTRSDPPTATFRAALYDHHLRVALDLDADMDRALRTIRDSNPHIANKTAGLRGFLADLVVGVVRGTARARGLRVVLHVATFDQDIRAALETVHSVTIRDMVGYIGPDRIVAIALRALRDVSQEQTVAMQLKSTAQTIRKLEDLLARGKLMDEDIYELKLRRDLFLNALRLYARLTR